jgi:hypothetical protein
LGLGGGGGVDCKRQAEEIQKRKAVLSLALAADSHTCRNELLMLASVEQLWRTPPPRAFHIEIQSTKFLSRICET